eukprot:246633_1
MRKRYIPPHKRKHIASNPNQHALHHETPPTRGRGRGRGSSNYYTAHNRSYTNFKQQRPHRRNYNYNDTDHSHPQRNHYTSPPRHSRHYYKERVQETPRSPPLSVSSCGSSSLHTSNECTFIENDEKEENLPGDDDHKANADELSSPAPVVPQPEEDKAFLEYLEQYKLEHKCGYVAPFQIKRIQREYESAIKERRKQNVKQAKKLAIKEHDQSENESENETQKETQNETTNDYPMEYLFFRDFYLKHSAYFREWSEMRQDGWNNKHLEKFFNLKHKNQDNVSRSSDKNIVSLFRRFYRYAIDIDAVCGYKQHLVSLLDHNHNNKLYFLDIGFAPGGMSRLLLDAHDHIFGVGITLPPYESGNAFINELLHSPRFLCREHDIVQLGRKVHNRSDFLSQCIANDYAGDGLKMDINWKAGFAGFDLTIVGITCHQDFNSNERLDHQILLSELYLAFLTLNHGGSILIRHKIALDCIHQHILYIFLKCFKEYKVGKPMTEFAIRKTFWILWKGFDKNICRELKLISFLMKLIHEYDGTQPPYGKNPKTQQYHNPRMIDKTPQEIVDELQPQAILNVMDPVFEIQMKSLKSFCGGKKDRLCSKLQYCNRKDCNRAHTKEECINGFYEALQNVDYVVSQQVAAHKHHSKILTSLGKLITNKRKQQKTKAIHNHNQKHHQHTYHNDNDLQTNWRR